MMVTLAGDGATKGRKVGIFAPEHKQIQEPYDELLGLLSGIRARASKTEGTIRTTTGGQVDFWPLTDNELAGRGREYDLIFVDEAAFTKNGQMLGIWEKSLKPTMLTRRGSSAWLFSTPNGIDQENFFYWACRGEGTEFVEHYAPSISNPLVPPEEIEKHRRQDPPLVFQQEYLAEFVDWGGVAFFAEDHFLVDGKPVAPPAFCDAVYAIIDSAVKTGSKNDGTAVVYFAFSRFPPHQLYVVDWDITQVEGALLENWLPSVFQRLEVLAKELKAIKGSLGAYIEDKASGTILVQQARRRGWPAVGIDAKITAMGKDERSLNVSGYHYQGLCKITEAAYRKIAPYKGYTRNHFLSQVCGFRIGIKDQADDLLDGYIYGLAAAFGDKRWF